jgi:CxxC-x17-CxxC domain-containing protein
LTIVIDDAGSGDLLHGVVIGAYREETDQFTYEIIDVKYYQELFPEKIYFGEASRVIFELLKKLDIKNNEEIRVCQGSIFDRASDDLKEKYGEKLISRVRVTGEAQRLVETSYLDEIRNLGYEPLEDREDKRAKSFFHMMRWLKTNPERLKFAKTGWPRLKRYKLFNQSKIVNLKTKTICSKCGKTCKVPFKPDKKRSVFCIDCLKKRKPRRKTQLKK